jgi:hypothetical protein
MHVIAAFTQNATLEGVLSLVQLPVSQFSDITADERY